MLSVVTDKVICGPSYEYVQVKVTKESPRNHFLFHFIFLLVFFLKSKRHNLTDAKKLILLFLTPCNS